MRRFLQDILQVNGLQAEVDACKVEHLLSVETTEKLLHLVRFQLSGNPVSSAFLEAFRAEAALCHDLAECPRP